MNKTYGVLSDFSYIKKNKTRIVVGYNLQQVDDKHYTWNEIYFYKKINGIPTFEQIRSAIYNDINEQVTKNIVEGFEWNGHKVWLSMENQQNYKNAADNALLSDGATLPVTFRFGDGITPDYYTFEDVDTLNDFWIGCTKHITDCLNWGWEKKDEIDWTNYEKKTIESNEVINN